MTVSNLHAGRHFPSSTRRIDGCVLKACAVIAALTGFDAKVAALEPPPKWETLKPVLEERCYDCHGGIKTKGGVDLKRLEKDPSLEAEYPLWEKVQEVVGEGKMPPAKADPLTAEEKSKLLGWVTKSLDYVAYQNAGDPGPVTMRRLTNAEYDCTIRDLTGIDFGLAKEFQADGGGGEGFSNTGDVLFVSPQQLDKYLAAARKLSEQASILPGTGIVFHEQRVGLRGPDQLKAQAEQALYVWYQHKAEPHLPTDDDDLREADYMLACWKFKYRDQTGATSLDQLAQEMKLQPAFLQNWWNLLNKPEPKSRFLDLTRVPWRELPGPDAAAPKTVPPAVLATLSAVQEQRRSWLAKKRKDGSGVQRQQQDADGLRAYDLRLDVSGHSEVHLCIGDDGDGNKGDIALVSTASDHQRQGIHRVSQLPALPPQGRQGCPSKAESTGARRRTSHCGCGTDRQARCAHIHRGAASEAHRGSRIAARPLWQTSHQRFTGRGGHAGHCRAEGDHAALAAQRLEDVPRKPSGSISRTPMPSLPPSSGS